jgi:hypothetical protein
MKKSFQSKLIVGLFVIFVGSLAQADDFCQSIGIADISECSNFSQCQLVTIPGSTGCKSLQGGANAIYCTIQTDQTTCNTVYGVAPYNCAWITTSDVQQCVSAQ